VQQRGLPGILYYTILLLSTLPCRVLHSQELRNKVTVTLGICGCRVRNLSEKPYRRHPYAAIPTHRDASVTFFG